MATTGKSTISHLPVSGATHVIPSTAGGPPKTVTTPAMTAKLVIGGISIPIDITKHSAQNVTELINSSGAATAVLDLYGRLIISGSSGISGDAALLAALGLA